MCTSTLRLLVQVPRNRELSDQVRAKWNSLAFGLHLFQEQAVCYTAFTDNRVNTVYLLLNFILDSINVVTLPCAPSLVYLESSPHS